MNLRGQIVTGISLERRLALPAGSSKASFNIIIHQHDELIGILVDRLGDIIEIDESLCEAPPITVDPKIRKLLIGVHKLENSLLMILNLERTLDKCA